jgi:pimeloyl-ACP methyl ester carboxylesterase
MTKLLRYMSAAASVAAAIEVLRLRGRFHTDLDKAREALRAVHGMVVSTSFGDVEYAELGAGEPVLVVHGIFGGRDQGIASWDDMLVDRRVIAPSRFGYLGSSMPAGATPAMQADAFAELMDRLSIDSIDVVGYSAGSVAALQLALRHPHRVKHLAIMCGDLPGPTAKAPPRASKLLYRSEFAMWLPKVAAPGLLMRFVGGLPKGSTPSGKDRDSIFKMLDLMYPTGERADGVIFDAFVSNPAVNAFPLEDIAVPTLFVHARDDNLASFDASRTSAARVPGARFVPLDTGGHLMLGQEDIVRDALRTFLTTAPTARERTA